MPRISKSTEHNWRKLHSDSREKLTQRANKTRSARRITPTRYLDDSKANVLLRKVLNVESPADDIMYTLVCSALESRDLMQKKHVRAFLDKYSHLKRLDIDVPAGTWMTQEDVLGYIYQSLISEGERNLTGQYYTARGAVDYIVDGKELAETETFLDPCCGSGAFLMRVTTNCPSHLYGFDVNPTAVMIASANLLLKYDDKEFTPHVYCLDFLAEGSLSEKAGCALPRKFDNIYTNPPWGSDKEGLYCKNYPSIRSKERASMVVMECLSCLSPSGTLCLLLPTSLLKIRVHRDIRQHILTHASIRQIDLFQDRFDGVFTDFFSIKLGLEEVDNQSYVVTGKSGASDVSLSRADILAGRIVLEPLSDLAHSIIKKMESRCHDRLTHSQWALGIVTGDNRNKVKKEEAEGMEPVYAGKQVAPFRLQAPNAYIQFQPQQFQQCAREELYRAPEKLIYKFIAKYPVVAYDDRQCLCLNSANILIPQLDTISIRSVAALLNSSLYRYYYALNFPDIKILKSNLQELPFPRLTRRQDHELSTLASTIHASSLTPELQSQLDRLVYSIFGITAREQAHILLRGLLLLV